MADELVRVADQVGAGQDVDHLALALVEVKRGELLRQLGLVEVAVLEFEGVQRERNVADVAEDLEEQPEGIEQFDFFVHVGHRDEGDVELGPADQQLVEVKLLHGFDLRVSLFGEDLNASYRQQELRSRHAEIKSAFKDPPVQTNVQRRDFQLEVLEIVHFVR